MTDVLPQMAAEPAGSAARPGTASVVVTCCDHGAWLGDAIASDLARPGWRGEGLAGPGLARRLAPQAFGPALADGSLGLGRRIERRLPAPLRRAIRRGLGRTPPPGAVAWGDLRRTTPIGPDYGYGYGYGYGRGTAVDRDDIEAFLAREAGSIAGHVLEIGDDTYTRRFGGKRVTRSDVLHVSPVQIVVAARAVKAGGQAPA